MASLLTTIFYVVVHQKFCSKHFVLNVKLERRLFYQKHKCVLHFQLNGNTFFIITFTGGKIGPLFGPYKYNSDFGSRAVLLSCQTPQPIQLTNGCSNGFKPRKLDQFYAYFSGGGAFCPYPKGSFETRKIIDSYHKENGLPSEDQTYSIEFVKSYGHLPVESNDKKEESISCPKSSPTESDVEVLCSYSEMKGAPAAIVKCCVGKGQAVLSSVHVEYDSQCLDDKNVYLKPIIDTLKNFDTDQSIIFRYMLKCLGISINLNYKL